MRTRQQAEKATSEEAQHTVQAQPMTPDEIALCHRAASEGHDWQTITEGDMEDFSLELDPNRLPPCFQKLQDERKFAFRWVEHRPEPIDKRRRAPFPHTWYIVNSTAPIGISAKELSSQIDSVVGCVVHADRILMYKPWWMHEKRNDLVQERTKIQEQGGVVKNRDGQKPKDGIEYHSGERYKIDPGRDVVLQDEAEVEHIYGQGRESSGDLGDVVVE